MYPRGYEGNGQFVVLCPHCNSKNVDIEVEVNDYGEDGIDTSIVAICGDCKLKGFISTIG